MVPLLLTDGYHARVDIPAALAPVPRAVQQPVLGPDPLLADALLRRLREAGARPATTAWCSRPPGPATRRRGLQCEQAAHALVGAARPARCRPRTRPGRAVRSPTRSEPAPAARRERRARAGGCSWRRTCSGRAPWPTGSRRRHASAGAVASAPLGTAPELVELVRGAGSPPPLAAGPA